MSLAESLRAHLDRFSAAPILFIGSGFSRRYLGLETWEDLLRRFSAETAWPYEYFRASANGDFSLIGSKIAEEFHDLWWAESKFEDSRTTWQAHANTRSSALKIEIAKYLGKESQELPSDPDLAAELALLQTVTVDGVITTNWDLLIEAIFPDFKTYVGQDGLLFSAPLGIGEIYKIHGCCSQPNSLVLTQEDYARFNERNPYLAAKLLTMFIEHPVVFLGYSLNDENVGQILRSIAACLTNQNLDQLQDRLIFIEWSPSVQNDYLSRSTRIIDNHSIPLCRATTTSYSPIFEALAANRRKFPARLLRRLKEHVYELVATNDPRERLFVQDIDEDTDLSNLDVVFGIGTGAVLGTEGYRGITRADVIEDILDDNKHYNPNYVVDDALPALLRGATKFIPCFKYLRAAGRLNSDGALAVENLPERVKMLAERPFDDFNSTAWWHNKRESINCDFGTLSELIAAKSPEEVLYAAPMLEIDKIDVPTLERFLKDNRSFLTGAHSLHKNQFIKLVCALDFLKYREAA